MKFLLKNWLYLLVLVVEGGSLMAVELMGAKYFAPFFGNSLYVWTTVLAITVLGLSLGYYIGAQLSQRKFQPSLIGYILVLSGILVFLMPFTVQLVTEFGKAFNLIPGVCIASLIVVFPIIFLFGLVGPLIIQNMSPQLDQLGSISGITYFTSTLSGILATFLFGTYLFPEFGMIWSSKLVGGSLLLCGCLFLLVSRKSSEVISQESKNEQIHSFSESLSPFLILLIAALEGTMVMVVEIIGARMLGPIYGASFHVWVVVIGITLTSLAIGYFLGGLLADRKPYLKTVYLILLLASSIIVLMHFTARVAIFTFSALDLSVSLLLSSLAILLPPLILLGMIPTLLIRVGTLSTADSGKMAGFIFSASSFSGIVSLFLLGFWIIPNFGLTYPSIIAGFCLGIIPLIHFGKKMESPAIFYVVVALLSYSQISRVNSSNNVKVLEYSEGLFGQVLVMEYPVNADSGLTKSTGLFLNRVKQSSIDPNQHKKASYLHYVETLSQVIPRNSNTLIVGLGGGLLANVLSDAGFKVDAVELDERIVDASRTYFDLRLDVNVVVDDGRHFLETTEKQYDLIVMDAFKGGYQPENLLTVETFERIKNMLTEDGIMVLNYVGYLEGKPGIFGRSVLKTIQTMDLKVRLLPTPGIDPHRNLLYLANRRPEVYYQLDNPLKEFKGTAIKDQLLNTDNYLDKDALIFYDDLPKVNRMNYEAVFFVRQSFKSSTSYFLGEGIPMFK